MSFNKEKMNDRLVIELSRNNSTDGHFADVLDLYTQNPVYPKLAYHNVDHVVSVLSLFGLLLRMSPKDPTDGYHLAAARTALAFHDIDHSGHGDSVLDENGLNNIDRAIARYLDYIIDGGLTVTQQQQDLVVGYICATQYPPIETLDVALDPKVVALIRDADMLWGMMPGNQEQCMLGLWMEQVNSGAVPNEPCDIEQLLVRQIGFIRDYKPGSRAGSAFKSAFWVEATENWAMVALEFMRQEEAARMVSAMADGEVLQLRSAIKKELPRPTA